MSVKNAGWHYQRAYILAKRKHLAREERIGKRAMDRSRGRKLDAHWARYVEAAAKMPEEAA